MANITTKYKTKVIKSDGEVTNSFSDSCPKCGKEDFESSISKRQDFDERGWFYPATFTCNNPACGHKWVERLLSPSGGLSKI